MSAGTENIIKGATNEWVLLLYRAITAGCALIVTWFVTDMRSGQERLVAQFNDFRLTNESRISKVEGEVGLLRGSVEVHRKRIEGNDADIRGLWGRMYDFNKSKSGPP